MAIEVPLIYARVTSTAFGFILACTGAASAAACSHPRSAEILRDLGPGASIGKTMHILEKRKSRISIWYKADARAAERGTTAAKLPSLKYHSLDVSVVFPFPGGFIVSTDERLSLAFNSHGVLTGWSCKKEYMGP